MSCFLLNFSLHINVVVGLFTTLGEWEVVVHSRHTNSHDHVVLGRPWRARDKGEYWEGEGGGV